MTKNTQRSLLTNIGSLNLRVKHSTECGTVDKIYDTQSARFGVMSMCGIIGNCPFILSMACCDMRSIYKVGQHHRFYGSSFSIVAECCSVLKSPRYSR